MTQEEQKREDEYLDNMALRKRRYFEKWASRKWMTLFVMLVISYASIIFGAHHVWAIVVAAISGTLAFVMLIWHGTVAYNDEMNRIKRKYEEWGEEQRKERGKRESAK